MSHWVSVQAEIKDLDALEEALKKMGYSNIKRNCTARGYGTQNHKCDLVVVQDRYDIGFKLNANGTCDISADFSMIHINEKKFRNEVMQNYSYCKIMKALRRKGLTAKEKVEKDGTIKLTVDLGRMYG